MAVDEALLERAAGGAAAVWLRFYQWETPTLSLGYFQNFSESAVCPLTETCDVVRRPTGGGAILHDRELTYSLILPAQHAVARTAEQLYNLVHQALIQALGGFGVNARLCGPLVAQVPGTSRQESFLCFLRHAPSDVLASVAGVRNHDLRENARAQAEFPLGGLHKICGSAQRRRRGARLMHGSLLLAASPLAPQIPGIKEVTGNSLSLSDVRAAWTHELLDALEVETSESTALTDNDRRRARHYHQVKYSDPAWTSRR